MTSRIQVGPVARPHAARHADAELEGDRPGHVLERSDIVRRGTPEVDAPEDAGRAIDFPNCSHAPLEALADRPDQLRHRFCELLRFREHARHGELRVAPALEALALVDVDEDAGQRRAAAGARLERPFPDTHARRLERSLERAVRPRLGQDNRTLTRSAFPLDQRRPSRTLLFISMSWTAKRI
jgi:hypothetical protein